MKRILILCAKEWTVGEKNIAARYAHEVFSRIALQKHTVAWFAHRPLPLFARGARRAPMETRDNIQFARLGPMFGYRFSVAMVLKRLEKLDIRNPFDIMVECVERSPLPLEESNRPRLLSIVFRPLRASYVQCLSRPLITATEEATASLQKAGIPSGHIIRAYAGADASDWNRTAGLVLAAIENLEHEIALRASVPAKPI